MFLHEIIIAGFADRDSFSRKTAIYECFEQEVSFPFTDRNEAVPPTVW